VPIQRQSVGLFFPILEVTFYKSEHTKKVTEVCCGREVGILWQCVWCEKSGDIYFLLKLFNKF